MFLGVISLLVFATCSSCKTMEGMPQSILVEPKGITPEMAAKEDSITVIATKRFKSNFIKNAFQGKNYRKAWATPIRVPVKFLDEIEGGIIPLEMGGGFQTLSMDLQGKNDIVYTLRSVNKNPDELIPNFARKLNLGNIVMDGMSAQHPYGALVVAPLADAIGILHTHPKLMYLPPQTQLDTFNSRYGGRLFLLEYEPEGSGAWVNREGVKEIINTESVQKMLIKYPDSEIDKKALVRARLFDLMIGDWDRHAKQWGWVVIEEEGKPYTYLPLPTDRDNAFYNPNGLIPWTVGRPFIQPLLRPFRKKIDYLPGMIKPFDQYFLLDVPESVFIEVAKELQVDFTDEEIENAFSVWSDDFNRIDKKKMVKYMKARRADLLEYAKEFKQILVGRGPLLVPLKGSDEIYPLPQHKADILSASKATN